MSCQGRHGRWWTYQAGCRCEECRYAFTVHRRIDSGKHGAEEECSGCGRWYLVVAMHENQCPAFGSAMSYPRRTIDV